MTNLERTRAFLQSFTARDGSTLDYYAPDAVQRELPNQLTKHGATRDRAALAASAERGRQSVREESYELLLAVEQGDTVACEVMWTSVLNVGFGALQPGDTMRAHLTMFLTWRDGKIISQRNYDCFEPF